MMHVRLHPKTHGSCHAMSGYSGMTEALLAKHLEQVDAATCIAKAQHVGGIIVSNSESPVQNSLAVIQFSMRPSSVLHQLYSAKANGIDTRDGTIIGPGCVPKCLLTKIAQVAVSE